MTSFYYVFLAVMLAGIGARDLALVSGLTLAQGRRPATLVTAILASVATAAFAAWAAFSIAPMLAPRARVFFAAMALALAGIESLVIKPRRRPIEPTRSLFAAALALIVLQAIDAARFLIFAIAVATNSPVPAGIAGAIAGSALLLAGWIAPQVMLNPVALTLRRIVGVVMLLIGLLMGLRILEYV